jgi:hypothetical protein
LALVDLAKQKMFYIGLGLWLIDKDIAFLLVLCGSVWLEWVRQVWINFIGDQFCGSPLEIEHAREKQFLVRYTH